MNKIVRFGAVTTAILLTFINVAKSQECKVLLDSISDSYQGGCKNGLAQGEGVAQGKHTYEGNFKQGLPHGMGTYTWPNGDYYKGKWKSGKMEGKGLFYSNSKDQKISGIWKDNLLFKETKQSAYKVLEKMYVQNVRFEKKIEKPVGFVQIYINGNRNVDYDTSLELIGSSGRVIKSFGFYAFDNVDFPFEATISFIQQGPFIVTVKTFAKIQINEVGAWDVTIDF